jgi:predicted site-specific integrase-resolvase
MAIFFCDHCRKETKFLPIHASRQAAGISRSTVYYWMDRAWIHWRELPSGRRVICQESLSHRARQPDAELRIAAKNSS